MTQHDPALYLTHILESADLIESYVHGLTLEMFRRDQQRQDAVIRRIEIMGEAVKNLPPDLRDSHPNVPWRRIAGMRDKVIHGYIFVDVELVWAVATATLPQLRVEVRAILDGLPRASDGPA
ncbi:MAG: DUF86 domain-containing protein [Longimicrobiales bacterium]